MEKTAFGSKLKSGSLFGAWCNFASFSCVELMTLLGFDFIVLDLQHSEITLSHIPQLLGPFGPSPTQAVVRAPQNSYHAVNWLLDQGVEAVIVPMVNSVEDARRAVEAAKFPPKGRRSFGPFRAARYGTELQRYMSRADEVSTLIAQVEDAAMATNIDELLALPGIDAVMMGPNDLAFSMLKKGESISADPNQYTAFARTPAVLDLCAHVLERCRVAEKPFGMTAGSITEARQWVERGASFVTFGSDFAFLRAGAEHLCQRKGPNT